MKNQNRFVIAGLLVFVLIIICIEGCAPTMRSRLPRIKIDPGKHIENTNPVFINKFVYPMNNGSVVLNDQTMLKLQRIVVCTTYHTDSSSKIDLINTVPIFRVEQLNMKQYDSSTTVIRNSGKAYFSIYKQPKIHLPNKILKSQEQKRITLFWIYFLVILLIIIGIIFIILSATASVSIGLIQPFLMIGLVLSIIGILALAILIFLTLIF